ATVAANAASSAARWSTPPKSPSSPPLSRRATRPWPPHVASCGASRQPTRRARAPWLDETGALVDTAAPRQARTVLDIAALGARDPV
ncbi:hypothetical protein, partial [Streptomyces sp. NPDC005877]|uniref:hypothetical protein n=1 Tax=Streptomyces sp. NPDC005877 TaxID=3155346 RepID=UPI0033E8575A